MRIAFFAWESLHSVRVGGVAVHVIRTYEERMIAKTVCRILGLGLKKDN
jgi:acetate kinase